MGLRFLLGFLSLGLGSVKLPNRQKPKKHSKSRESQKKHRPNRPSPPYLGNKKTLGSPGWMMGCSLIKCRTRLAANTTWLCPNHVTKTRMPQMCRTNSHRMAAKQSSAGAQRELHLWSRIASPTKCPTHTAFEQPNKYLHRPVGGGGEEKGQIPERASMQPTPHGSVANLEGLHTCDDGRVSMKREEKKEPATHSSYFRLTQARTLTL